MKQFNENKKPLKSINQLNQKNLETKKSSKNYMVPITSVQ